MASRSCARARSEPRVSSPVPLPDGSPACGGLVGAQEWSPSLRLIVAHTAVCVRNPLLCPELLP